LNHGIFVDGYNILSPTHPEIGKNGIYFGLYPTFYK